MKRLVLCGLLLAGPDGDRELGMRLYAEGRYAEAAAAFRAALRSEGELPDLQYNLALASWRAGDLAAAEVAIEKYAATARRPRPELHAGLLGALRFDEARAMQAAVVGAEPAMAAVAAPPAAVASDPVAALEQALQRAEQARDWFVRGSLLGNTSELRRNTERALRLIQELQQQLAAARQQQQQDPAQQPDDGKQAAEDKQAADDPAAESSPQQQQQQQEEQQSPAAEPPQQPEPGQEQQPATNPPAEPEPGEPKPGEPKPGEPSAAESPEPQPQSAGEPEPTSEDQPAPSPASSEEAAEQPPPVADAAEQPGKESPPRLDAPGEQAAGKELSPEQTQRLLEALREGEARLKEARQRALRSARRSAEQDW